MRIYLINITYFNYDVYAIIIPRINVENEFLIMKNATSIKVTLNTLPKGMIDILGIYHSIN